MAEVKVESFTLGDKRDQLQTDLEAFTTSPASSIITVEIPMGKIGVLQVFSVVWALLAVCEIVAMITYWCEIVSPLLVAASVLAITANVVGVFTLGRRMPVRRTAILVFILTVVVVLHGVAFGWLYGTGDGTADSPSWIQVVASGQSFAYLNWFFGSLMYCVVAAF